MISVLLDANVLYPAPIRDLLLTLAEMEQKVLDIMEKVAQETGIELRIDSFQTTPGGQIEGALTSPLVKSTMAIRHNVGFKPSMSNAGSSNMNIAIPGAVSAIGLADDRVGKRAYPN